MAAQQEKRTIKSLTKTAKYHALYIGNILVVCLGLIFLLYLMVIHKIMEVVGHDNPAALRDLLISVSVAGLMVAGCVTLLCMLTAHRVAGVHIKLKSTFDRIKQGDLDTRLSFRKGDHLDDVAHSFNDMLETLLGRVEKEKPLSSEEETSQE